MLGATLYAMVHEPTDAELMELERALKSDGAPLRALDLYVAALDALSEARDEGIPLEVFELEVCATRGEVDYLLGKFV